MTPNDAVLSAQTEISRAKEVVRALLVKFPDPELSTALAQVSGHLTNASRDIARIPSPFPATDVTVLNGRPAKNDYA